MSLPDALLPRALPCPPWLARAAGLGRRVLTREVLVFLAVGGVGYVVDVAGFNLLRATPTLGRVDPSYARVLAVVAATAVTYLGNRTLTWRGRSGSDRRREVALFVAFNLVGLGISVACLLLTHDLLGLTGRLADNLSANVVGIGLGTLFRFWAYRRFVFRRPDAAPAPSPGEPTRTACPPPRSDRRTLMTQQPTTGTTHRPRTTLYSSLIGLASLAILLQGLWAGLFVHEGRDYQQSWVEVHARGADVAIVLSVVALGVALWKHRGRRDLVVGTAALAVLLVLEAYLGGLVGAHPGATAVHVPIAMGLMGLAVWLPLRAVRR